MMSGRLHPLRITGGHRKERKSDSHPPARRWYDQSGNGSHAVVPSGKTPPIYDFSNAMINADVMRLPSVYFTGSECLQFPDGAMPYDNSAFTMFVVHGPLDVTYNTTQGTFVCGGDFAGNNSYRVDDALRNNRSIIMRGREIE